MPYIELTQKGQKYLMCIIGDKNVALPANWLCCGYFDSAFSIGREDFLLYLRGCSHITFT